MMEGGRWSCLWQEREIGREGGGCVCGERRKVIVLAGEEEGGRERGGRVGVGGEREREKEGGREVVE